VQICCAERRFGVLASEYVWVNFGQSVERNALMQDFRGMVLGSLAMLAMCASCAGKGGDRRNLPTRAFPEGRHPGLGYRADERPRRSGADTDLRRDATVMGAAGAGRQAGRRGLGARHLAEYEAAQNYFGATVGRFANRIAHARFTLNGKTYLLPANDGSNSLHGGGNGFDRRNWTIKAFRSGEVASVSLGLYSPDGDAGSPGNLDVTVTYSMNVAGSLTIAFEARTDRATVVNMTNHAFFNLSGGQDPVGILGHRLTMPASHYTPVDASLIPTGELRSVAGTVFDFRKGKIMSRRPARRKGWNKSCLVEATITTF